MRSAAFRVIAKICIGGGQGYILEYRGEAVRNLSMEGRMTLCNMSIEAGACAGLIAPDDTAYAYLEGRAHAPQGDGWDATLANWSTLHTDEGARFDAEITVDADALTPFVTWATNPGQGALLGESVPDPAAIADLNAREGVERALEYMGLTPGMPLHEISVDTVFLDSCIPGLPSHWREGRTFVLARKP